MVYLLDYKVSEVAGTLHLNRTTLDYRLKKMVQKLREIYGNYGRPKRR
jgi:DNA-directed RNA polymerase specialized sigma24 family protein